MAVLAGYLINERGTIQEFKNFLPPVFGPVFEPEMQSTEDIYVSAKDHEAFLAALPPITRVSEAGKTRKVQRCKFGANRTNGPAGIAPGRYSDDFYHRIHITPSVLKMGNLISTQFRSIEVWNAYFSSKDLTNVQGLNAEGIVLTPPEVPPYTMVALENLIYDVSISTEGPPAIDATLRWTIDGVDYDVPVTGQRVITMPFLPDWVKPPVEVLEWKTDVIKARNGEEQRSKIRGEARRSEEYTYTLQGVQAQSMDNLLWGWQNRLYALPHWTDSTLNQTSLFSGQTVISVDTTNYCWAVGELFFVTDGVTFEMQEIEAVGVGDITLKAGIDKEWGRPTLLAPASLARIDGDMSVKSKRQHADISESRIKYMFEPLNNDPFIPTSTAPRTYLSEELYVTEPNWVGGRSDDFQTDAQVLDFETSGFAISQGQGFPDIVRDYEWIISGRANITDFRKFLGRREGQYGGFWMPSWRNDFTINTTVSSGDGGFTAHENYYGLLVNGAQGRNHFYIRLKDGTEILKEIQGAAINGTDVNVTIADSMGATFLPTDVTICCILEYHRLLTDRISIEYLDRDVIKVKTSMVNILP